MSTKWFQSRTVQAAVLGSTVAGLFGLAVAVISRSGPTSESQNVEIMDSPNTTVVQVEGDLNVELLDSDESEDRPSASQEIAPRLTDQLQTLQAELALRGVQPGQAETAASGTSETSVEDLVRDAVQSVPGDVQAIQERHIEALVQESQAQQLAEQIDREFRPRLDRVIALIYGVVSQAAEAGLVELESQSPPLTLPSQTTFTTFVLAENEIARQQPEHSMSFQFAGDVEWRVFLQVGMVRSPAELGGRSWNAPTEKYYPMLLVRERPGAAEEELDLGTVWFHQDSKELGFALGSRGDFSDSLLASLVAIEGALQGEDAINAMLVEFLKSVRIHGLL